MNVKIPDNEYIDNIPDGIHRCRILTACKTKSKKGNDMLKIVMDVYGYYHHITHYITFLPDRPEIASRNLHDLFESCPGIRGQFDTGYWLSHELAAEITHEEYEGRPVPRIVRFVPESEQGSLPHFYTGSGVHVYENAIG